MVCFLNSDEFYNEEETMPYGDQQAFFFLMVMKFRNE
jgi:hypothetical protein